MRRSTSSLARSLREKLQAVADPTRAGAMQAYMKSTMPYLGVAAPVAKPVFRAWLEDHPFDDAAKWRAEVLAIWRGAAYREERYGAIALCRHRKAKPFQTLEALPVYDEMIVTGAWWDHVDEVATHPLRDLLQAFPREMKKTMRAWSRDDDMWRRRSSIICQVGLRGATDVDLLHACIQPSIGSKEFFLRKAIGWALRDLAKTDPDGVALYVKEHEHELSGLSKREALKHL